MCTVPVLVGIIPLLVITTLAEDQQGYADPPAGDDKESDTEVSFSSRKYFRSQNDVDLIH